MFNTTGGYSLADIAAATGSNNNGGAFGNGETSWILILFLLFAFGWGNGNGGFGGGNSGSVKEEIAYGFDNNQIQNGIRGIQQGICDSTYALNTGMLNGFAGVTNTLTQGFTGLNATVTNGFSNAELARCNSQAQLMAMLNQMNYNAQDCCCQTQRAIDGVNFNAATNACNTQRAIADAARDIIENANANYRALHEENIAIQMAQKDDRIADLTAQLNKADLRASQAAQNTYLINQLKPCPEPAYIVPNPYCCNPTPTLAYTAGCGC